MIFRRISDALKRQDWGTVLVEFVLVILGVLIALQVTNWNEARKARNAERRILERMHEEVISVRASRQRNAETERKLLDLLYAARMVLFEKVPRDTLTPQECTALGDSDWPFIQRINVPVIDELLATGRLDLITNEDILRAVSGLLERRAINDTVLDDLRPFRHELSTEFPELIAYDLVATDNPNDADGFDAAYRCDVAAVKSSQHFMNAVGENITTFVNMYGSGYGRSEQAFENLHAAIDASLGIVHSEEEEEDDARPLLVRPKTPEQNDDPE